MGFCVLKLGSEVKEIIKYSNGVNKDDKEVIILKEKRRSLHDR